MDGTMKAVFCADDDQKLIFATSNFLQALGLNPKDRSSFGGLNSLTKHINNEKDCMRFLNLISKALLDIPLNASVEITNTDGKRFCVSVSVAPITSFTHIITHLLVVLTFLDTESRCDVSNSIESIDVVQKTDLLAQPSTISVLTSKVRSICTGLRLSKAIQDSRSKSLPAKNLQPGTVHSIASNAMMIQSDQSKISRLDINTLDYNDGGLVKDNLRMQANHSSLKCKCYRNAVDLRRHHRMQPRIQPLQIGKTKQHK